MFELTALRVRVSCIEELGWLAHAQLRAVWSLAGKTQRGVTFSINIKTAHYRSLFGLFLIRYVEILLVKKQKTK
jgi:hypothetical protein